MGIKSVHALHKVSQHKYAINDIALVISLKGLNQSLRMPPLLCTEPNRADLDRSRTHLFNINCKSFKRRFFGLHNTPVIRKSRASFECTSINCELTGGLLDLTNYLRPAGTDPDRNTIKIIHCSIIYLSIF